MTDDLQALLDQRRLKISPCQLDRLVRVLHRAEGVTAWDDDRAFSGDMTVVVDEPRGPVQTALFCRSLPPRAKVVIPLSENPAFDFLKSKLHCHGVIGASAPSAPHQIWWGGPGPAAATGWSDAIRAACIVSCVQRDTQEDSWAQLLAKQLQALSIDSQVERTGPDTSWTALRSRLLLEAWGRTDKALIWLDPGRSSDLVDLAIDLKAADFAAILRWDASFSLDFLYFGRSDATFDLLKSWDNLCREFPALPDNFLLDTAWGLVSSQRTLVSVWAPHAHGRATTASPAPSFPLSAPWQRQARRANRTGAPEPHCVVRGKCNDGDPITLVVTSGHGCSAQDVTATTNGALQAFCDNDGGFSLLGVVICRQGTEAADMIQQIPQGWILYIAAGVMVEPDIFAKLADAARQQRPIFVLPKCNGVRQARNGVDLLVAGSQAILCRAELVNDAIHGSNARRTVLTLVHG